MNLSLVRLRAPTLSEEDIVMSAGRWHFRDEPIPCRSFYSLSILRTVDRLQGFGRVASSGSGRLAYFRMTLSFRAVLTRQPPLSWPLKGMLTSWVPIRLRLENTHKFASFLKNMPDPKVDGGVHHLRGWLLASLRLRWILLG
jgi:hypothetical protein